MAQSYYSPPTSEKSTRDCLDPWLFVMITANREVKPCCWLPPIGVLEKGASLEELLNGAEMRELRRELLTGELSEGCKKCPNRSLTDPESLRRRVRAELLQPR
jgi:MoaA/NifB/PqqE/SkfB family radical SAM enzyme